MLESHGSRIWAWFESGEGWLLGGFDSNATIQHDRQGSCWRFVAGLDSAEVSIYTESIINTKTGLKKLRVWPDFTCRHREPQAGNSLMLTKAKSSAVNEICAFTELLLCWVELSWVELSELCRAVPASEKGIICICVCVTRSSVLSTRNMLTIPFATTQSFEVCDTYLSFYWMIVLPRTPDLIVMIYVCIVWTTCCEWKSNENISQTKTNQN
jgi:hypothetical protein